MKCFSSTISWAAFSAFYVAPLLGHDGYNSGLNTVTIFVAMVAGIINTLGTVGIMVAIELSGLTLAVPIVVGVEICVGLHVVLH